MIKLKSEAAARMTINALLQNAGYRYEDNTLRVEGEFLSPHIKEKLNPKRPDYHLYAKNSIIPLAFLEAKAENSKNLDAALNQCIAYAKKSENKMICFASNGNVIRAKHSNGQDILINGNPIGEIPTIEILKDLIEQPNYKTGELIENTKHFHNIFKRAGNILRKAGVDPGIDSLRTFCSFMFLKIRSEQNSSSSKEKKNWNKLLNSRGEEILECYKEIVSKQPRRHQDIFTTQIPMNPEAFEEIIQSLNNVNLSQSNEDIKGLAFEYFLARYSANDPAFNGQFFTPRHIVRFMIKLAKPQSGEIVYDPFCGTGGMLIEAFDYIRKRIPNDNERSEKIKHLKNHAFKGHDISQSASALAKMNMILVGDGHTNIKQTDSTKENGSTANSADLVITNIPFNIRGQPDRTKLIEQYINETGQNPDMNEAAAVHCFQSVKQHGQIVMIVPITVIEGERYKGLMKWIYQRARIRAIFKLSNYVFAPYTTAKTAIIWADRLHSDETLEPEYPVIEVTNDGYSPDTARTPINGGQLDELAERSDQSSELEEYARMQQNAKDGKNRPEIPRRNYWLLKEITEVREEKSQIDPDKEYLMPRLNASNNTVTPTKNPKRGDNLASESGGGGGG